MGLGTQRRRAAEERKYRGFKNLISAFAFSILQLYFGDAAFQWWFLADLLGGLRVFVGNVRGKNNKSRHFRDGTCGIVIV